MVAETHIQRMTKKLDEVVMLLNESRTDIALIKQRLDAAPRIPDRPCSQLVEHIAHHIMTRTMWEQPIVHAVVNLIQMLIVGLVCFFIARIGL